MKNNLLFILTFFILGNLCSQDLRFSYYVTNPVSTESKLIVTVNKSTAGTENLTAFNYGFYYKSTEATVKGFAPGAVTTNMTATQLNNCVDFSYAQSLGWATDGTGAILAVTTPPPGVPAGYDRLFIGALTDGNGAGSDIGTTAIPIIAVTLDNTVNPATPASQDSAYMGASDTNPAWKYSDFNFSEFDIVTTGVRLQALPIILVSFEVDKYQERSSLLRWVTSLEINSSHFNIQRSFDSKTWSNIGKVSAQGNSQLIENYEFLDENVYNGIDARLTAYYRLQAVDLDNHSKIYPIKSVVFTGTSTTVSREIVAYPNPSSEGLQVEWDANRIDQPTRLEFFDIKGKLVYSKDVSDNTNQEYIDFNQTTIIPGLYILRILSDKEPIDHKQIVVDQR